MFNLCVDSFGIKSNKLDYAHHLLNAIRKYFKLSIDWEGQNSLGLTLYWNYTKNYIDVSMHGYVPTTLQRFQHKLPAHVQDAPHSWNKPVYGKQIQLATQQSSLPNLKSTDTNRVQSINRNFFYYARAVYPTMLSSLNNISTCQYSLTQGTLEKFNQVLDYASTQLNSNIRYHISDMILMTYTDASYLVFLPSCSRIAGHYYFTKRMPDYFKVNPTPNGPILT